MKKQINRCMVVAVVIIAGLQLLGCTAKSDSLNKIKAAHVEDIEGTEFSRITLSPKAMERLGIKTAQVIEMSNDKLPRRDAQVVRSGSGSQQRKVVPYSAVLYDAHGNTWVYTSPKPQTFIRHQISIDYIGGDLAVLSDGPPSGTEVVTVGAVELFGIDFEIGH